MQRTVSKSYITNFVRTILIILAAGSLVTATILYLLHHRSQGASYAESYWVIGELNRSIVHSASLLLLSTLLTSIAGIAIIAILYSHRVAGAVLRLGMRTKKITAGDMSESVKLRSSDALHSLADEFNALSARYRGTLLQVDAKARELSAALDDVEKRPAADADRTSAALITEKIREIRNLLSQVKV